MRIIAAKAYSDTFPYFMNQNYLLL